MRLNGSEFLKNLPNIEEVAGDYFLTVGDQRFLLELAVWDVTENEYYQREGYEERAREHKIQFPPLGRVKISKLLTELELQPEPKHRTRFKPGDLVTRNLVGKREFVISEGKVLKIVAGGYEVLWSDRSISYHSVEELDEGCPE